MIQKKKRKEKNIDSKQHLENRHGEYYGMECRIKKQCVLSIHYATVKVITVFFFLTRFSHR